MVSSFFNSSRSNDSFKWFEVDFTAQLPADWQNQIVNFATKKVVSKTIVPTSVTSRESDAKMQIPVLTVGGIEIKNGLPWLYDMYKHDFLEVAQNLSDLPVTTALDDRYGINLNVQRGTTMRYEAHVDSNPIEGLLYVTSHDEGSGGGLIVSQNQSALGVDEIALDCVRIKPKAGSLIFFDARQFPHFVEALTHEDGVRIAVTMNFYTTNCTERDRPDDLNKHLGLE